VPRLRRLFAEHDRDDVLAADMLVAFTEPPRSCATRGGRHVELGLALGYGKRVAVIGPRENVFCWLPQVEHYAGWPDLLAALPRGPVMTCGCGYDCPACADYEWACQRCNCAFFSTPPEDGLCPACRAGAEP